MAKERYLALAVVVILAGNLIQMVPFDQLFKKAEAQAAPVLVDRGRIHETWDMKDGSFKFVGGVPPWLWDQTQGKYVPHITRIVNSTAVEVQSGMVAWKIYPQDAELWDANMTRLAAKEKWLPSVDSTALSKFFSGQTVLQNATGVYVTNTYSATYGGNTITLRIIYAIHDGRATERIVTMTGVPNILASKVKIEREWVAIDADAVTTNRLTDSVNATTKTITQDGTHQVARFLKSGKLVVHENLWSAGETLKTIGFDTSKVLFTYSGWTTGDISFVDDTFTTASPTEDGKLSSTSATGTACPGSPFTRDNTFSTFRVYLHPSSASGACDRAYVEWPISSIPDGSTVTDTDFSDFGITTATNARNCDYMPLTNQPLTASDSTLWTDIGDGTAYVSNDATCTTTGSNKALDLGTAADTEVQARLTTGDWFAIGIKYNSETRDGSTHTQSFVAVEDSVNNDDPQLTVVYTPPSVTVPIQINMRTGSDTPETAGVSISVTCTGGGGTHDGNPATQNFTCNASVTVTVTMPTDTATSRFRFSDGTTSKNFPACGSGTCSTTTYSDVTRQFKQTITLSGVNSNVQIDITRVQVGVSGTTATSGSTATEIWADQASTFTVPNTKVITTDQDRYQSYNSTAQRAYTVSAGNTKTYIFNHEYNMLFRVNEEHLGTIFQPMPLATFTGTITTSNSTQLTNDFNVQTTDDYMEYSSRVWVKNGTTSWSNIKWRDIIVNATGSASITGYGTFDIKATSKHYGYNVDKHFRFGVDSGTVANIIYSDNDRTFSFDATATGTRVVKLEFTTSVYGEVSQVTVGGTPYDSANWSTQNLGNGLAVLTINNLSFSTKTIVVTLAAAGGGGGGGGGAPPSGGGGGGGGGFTPFPSGFKITTDLPPFNVRPGSPPQQQIMTVTVTGTTQVIFTSIAFTSHPEWFTVDRTLPYSELIGSDNKIVSKIPITLTLPVNATLSQQPIIARLSATTGASQAVVDTTVNINTTGLPIMLPSLNLALLFILILPVGIIVFRFARRRR